MFAAFDASTQVIGEGSRNATLSRFAGRVLIRYGQAAQARDLFDRKAAMCEPPLRDHELESICGSACRFAAKVEAQPGYLSPEAYAELTSLRPDDLTDVRQASMLTAEYSSRLTFTKATDWLVYEGGIWSESAPAAQGIAQELTDRQLAEAGHLLEKARDELMVTGRRHGARSRIVESEITRSPQCYERTVRRYKNDCKRISKRFQPHPLFA